MGWQFQQGGRAAGGGQPREALSARARGGHGLRTALQVPPSSRPDQLKGTPLGHGVRGSTRPAAALIPWGRAARGA